MANREIRHIRLGDFIVPKDERNSSNLDYKVMGMNSQKVFMPTVANLENIELSNYKIVRKGWFAFSGMQTGRDECIRIAIHESETPILISPAYTTFAVDNSKGVMSEYLYMYFYRNEMDRFGWFISDSSVRSNLDWPRFLDILLPVPYKDGKPDCERQQEIVNVWQGFRKMKRQNEELYEPLSQLCRSYLENLKSYCKPVEIGPFIEQTDERNSDGRYSLDNLRGLSIQKVFTDSKANMEGVSLLPYKVVHPLDFCFVTVTSRNSEKITLALNMSDEDYIVSSSYVTFKVRDKEKVDPKFLYLWFCRPEFDRYARFHSIGSARESFGYSDMEKVQIPLPDIDTQRAIVNIYHCAEECRRIATEADSLSQTVSPALMQHVIHEHN